MTGPEHYREAEHCAKQAASRFDRGDIDGDGFQWLALGQLHATLFLGAATVAAEALKCGFMTITEYEELAEAVGARSTGQEAAVTAAGEEIEHG